MRYAAVCLSLFLSGCFTTHYENYHAYLDSKNLPPISAEEFPHCFGYGCQYTQSVSLDTEQWESIKDVFLPIPETASEERNAIAQSIAVFEKYVGKITGTSEDRRGTFRALGEYQHDCEDESINTTIYLDLLDQKGLLKFHTIQQPEIRGPNPPFANWLHESAVIKDIETGQKYVVDSWWQDNGHPAYIVKVEEWHDGWRPATKSQEKSPKDEI